MLYTCQSVCIVVINTLEIITLFSVQDNMHLSNQRQERYRLIIPVRYMLPDIFFTLVFERMSLGLQILAWLAHIVVLHLQNHELWFYWRKVQ